MKATLVLIAMVVAVVCFAQPHPDTLWTLQLDGIYNDQANAIVETGDRGYLIVGTTAEQTGDPSYMFVVRTDQNGDTLWTRRYSGAAYDVIETEGSGFLIAGEVNGFAIRKIDSSGNEVLTETYGSGCAYCIKKTDDDGFVVGGYTMELAQDGVLMKFYQFGSMEWSCIWGDTDTDVIMSVDLEYDGGYIATGYTESWGHGFDDWLLQHTVSQGYVYWFSSYGSYFSDRGQAIIKTSDYSYIIGGYAAYPPEYNQNLFVRKRGMGITGSTIWTCTLGGQTVIGSVYSVEETPDGNYLVAGTIARPPSYDDELYLAKLSTEGEIMWERDYPGDSTHDNYGYFGMRTSDGGYIIAGSTTGNNAIGLDFYVVKTGPDYFGHEPQIVLSTDTLDFGFVLLEQPEELPLTIYSVGDTTLKLYDIFTSQHCFGTLWNPADSLVYPGDSLEITVYFSPDDSVTFDETLTIESNTGLIEVVLQGVGVVLSVAGGTSLEVPENYALNMPYPNPFNAVALISYDVPVSGVVQVEVYDVLGRKVAMLVDGGVIAGRHQMMWNAKGMPSGVYFVRMQTGEFRQIRKVVLLK